MKVYMLWDMEGVSGLFTREQCWYWEPGARPHVAAEGRGLMMADVQSACAAALAAGADEVIVCDTHHGGGNIVVDQMPADPRITYYGRSVGGQAVQVGSVNPRVAVAAEVVGAERVGADDDGVGVRSGVGAGYGHGGCHSC